MILLLVLLAYPVLGSVFLSSGVPERLIASDDLKIELRKPAWTLWPGHFHVPGVRILSNGTTQFKLEASNILVQMKLFPLIHRHLHVTSLVADGVRYWMRVQVQSSKGAEKRLAAYPVLDDLPGNPSLFEEKEQQEKGGGEKKQPDFTVEVDGIDVSVEELWFMEYHYLGKGTLQGSFLVGPHRMRVGTSVQNLGPGELRFGATTPLLRQFRGRIQAGIPDVNPEEHADSSFLPLVTTDTELHGDVVTLEPLSAYTGKIRLIDGAGSVDTHLKLAKGDLAESSFFRYTTKKAGIRGEGLGLDTDWDFDAQIAKGDGQVLPRIRSTAKTTYVSASNPEHRIFTVQVLGHEEDVVLQSTQLGRMTDIQHARIRLPHIFTKDLHDLAALTSSGGAIDSKSGEARASLNLDVDAHHIARGAFDASFDGVRLIASGVDVAAEGEMQSKIDANLDKKAASLRDLTWTVKNVDVRAAGRDEKGWWTTANVPYVGASADGKLEARFSLRSRNAAPLLDVLVEKDQLPGVVRSLTTLPDLRIRGELRKERDVMDVLMEPVENELFDVAGRYFAKGDRSQLAIVVGGKAVSLGIAKKTGAGTTLKPFAREGWLNEQLKSFPPPGRRFIVSEP